MIVSAISKNFNYYPSDNEINDFAETWINETNGQGGVYFKHSIMSKRVLKKDDNLYQLIVTLEMSKIKFWILVVIYLPFIFFIMGKEDGFIETWNYCKNVYSKIKKLNEKLLDKLNK